LVPAATGGHLEETDEEDLWDEKEAGAGDDEEEVAVAGGSSGRSAKPSKRAALAEAVDLGFKDEEDGGGEVDEVKDSSKPIVAVCEEEGAGDLDETEGVKAEKDESAR
jgi:hypothetical protein